MALFYKSIETKFHPPILSERRLIREELVSDFSIKDGMGSLVSLVAPAGSGKSTLLAEISSKFASEDIDVCWLSLDEDDNVPSVFANYFVGALSKINASFFEKEVNYLNSNTVVDYDSYFDSLVAQLSTINKNLAIFIDDFHFITDTSILRFWNRLISHKPQSMRLLIASRSELPLELARVRMSGVLRELLPDDLNFSVTQVGKFMRDVHKMPFSDKAVEALHRKTEGWVAGLQLASLAIDKDRADSASALEEFSSQDSNLKEYLLQSVFMRQREDVRRFLIDTSCLPKMNAELCNAVTGGCNAKEMLEYLYTHNLFVIALDRKGEWYRYHHLFSDFLRAELKNSPGDKYGSSCRNAARWCEEKGFITEAIQFFLAANEFDNAAKLIANHAPHAVLNNGNHLAVLEWMRRLPESYHDKWPETLLNYAWSLAFTRDDSRSAAIINNVISNLEDGADKWPLSDEERISFRHYAESIQLISMACADDTKPCISMCNDLEKKLFLYREELSSRKDKDSAEYYYSYNQKLLSVIFSVSSYCQYAQRHFSESASASSNAYFYGLQSGSPYAVVWSSFLNTLSNIQFGRITSAAESADRAVSNIDYAEHGKSYINGLASLAKAEVAMQRGHFDDAEKHLHKGKVVSSISGPLEATLLALLTEARLKAWQGSLGEARRVLHQGQSLALSSQQPRLYFTLAAEEVNLQLVFDDVHQANNTISRTGLSNIDTRLINSGNKIAYQHIERITEIRIGVYQDDSDRIIEKIDSFLRRIRGEQYTALRLHIRTLKAVVMWRDDQKTLASRELKKVVQEAAPEKHAYPIISAGPEVVEILNALDSAGGGASVKQFSAQKEFLSQLNSILLGGKTEIISTKVVVSRAPTESILKEPLTDREMEILKGVDRGLSNKEISESFSISLSTVKWHLHNIYEKCGVRSRSAAVARLREFDLM